MHEPSLRFLLAPAAATDLCRCRWARAIIRASIRSPDSSVSCCSAVRVSWPVAPSMSLLRPTSVAVGRLRVNALRGGSLVNPCTRRGATRGSGHPPEVGPNQCQNHRVACGHPASGAVPQGDASRPPLRGGSLDAPRSSFASLHEHRHGRSTRTDPNRRQCPSGGHLPGKRSRPSGVGGPLNAHRYDDVLVGKRLLSVLRPALVLRVDRLSTVKRGPGTVLGPMAR